MLKSKFIEQISAVPRMLNRSVALCYADTIIALTMLISNID